MKIERRRDFSTGDLPDMTRDELESAWHRAKECLDNALDQKIATDQIYVAAANKLNQLDRLIKKVERIDATAKRAEAKSSSLYSPNNGNRMLS